MSSVNSIRRRLSTKEAAEYMGISERTLEKYRVVGGGPPYMKIFNRVVYDTRDLDDWMESKRRLSTSDHGRA